MQIKIVIFLPVIWSLNAMEMHEMTEPNPQKPIVHLITTDQSQSPLQAPMVPQHDPDDDPELKAAAEQLINTIEYFKNKYPEKEIVRTLFHFHEVYATSYVDFIAKLDAIKANKQLLSKGDEHATGKVDEKDLIISFLDMMHKFRFSDAKWYRRAHKQLNEKHVALQDQHANLEVRNQEQIKKTQRSNWWALGATVGGAFTTFITGMLTWYFKACTALPTNSTGA